MKLLIIIFDFSIPMSIPEDVNNRSTRFFGKRILLAIIIILVAGLAFGSGTFLFTVHKLPLRIVMSICLPIVTR
jgi:hypothetical protein